MYYFGTSFLQVVQLVQTGHRLPPPPGCPRMVYSVMISCWYAQPLTLTLTRPITCMLQADIEDRLNEHINCGIALCFKYISWCVYIVREPYLSVSCHRHPQAHLRPDFSDIRGALRQSQMNVLQWAQEDMNKDPLSLHLGAPLIHGKDLFIDLQNQYLQ